MRKKIMSALFYIVVVFTIVMSAMPLLSEKAYAGNGCVWWKCTGPGMYGDPHYGASVMAPPDCCCNASDINPPTQDPHVPWACW